MNTNESFLGDCPNCGERIPEARLLVEYTKDDGHPF
jgi:RNA polymerase-binding transcription factor DksA